MFHNYVCGFEENSEARVRLHLTPRVSDKPCLVAFSVRPPHAGTGWPWNLRPLTPVWCRPIPSCFLDSLVFAAPSCCVFLVMECHLWFVVFSRWLLRPWWCEALPGHSWILPGRRHVKAISLSQGSSHPGTNPRLLYLQVDSLSLAPPVIFLIQNW